jgi:hypothetical protein
MTRSKWPSSRQRDKVLLTGSLHIAIRAPGVGHDGVHTSSFSLVREPDLILVVSRERNVVELHAFS